MMIKKIDALSTVVERLQQKLYKFDQKKLRNKHVLSLSLAALTAASSFAQTSSFTQTNIISSDSSIPAAKTDSRLINPWGLAIGKAFWIDSPVSGFSLVVDPQGNPQPPLAVAVPPPASAAPGTAGQPTGVVFNADTANFILPVNSQSAVFLFATLGGTIAAWNTPLTAAVTVADNSAAKAVYTGLAVDVNSTGSFLLAANQASGAVDVFDSKFAPAQLAGTFADPTLPTGFHAFSVHIINGQVFVGYTQIDPATGKRVLGAGLGFVNIFDLNGNFVKRAISNGNLNAPWGIVLAPSGFGSFSGDLLVGNFGDGVINVYDPTNFTLIGQVQDSKGNVLVNSGLWDLVFGAKGVGDPNTLFFAAGVNATKGGLFGSIAVAAPPAGSGDFTLAAATPTVSVTAGQSATVSLSLAGTNGFTGAIALSCSGLPTGDNCTFNPASVTLSGTAAATDVVTITTAPHQASIAAPHRNGKSPFSGIALAFAGPLGMLALVGLRRRSASLRGAVLVIAMSFLSFGMIGCGDDSSHPTAPVTTQVMINATAGGTTHSIPVTLTVN
ncbi:TIGR03118 family protein [Terriglobus saanensis]|uniref:TIGR03118 family protein n=1 Tax=Terriglobus saanensis (strain ATCC BAA-1853 / DSM 23119 / SP1PR4) TaxID=401053 RepID=E8V0P2_TERSS|nr:TIGR03118 family protein [Terriglobus saanensis]ADV81105.1 hypothetical protein AciPR4_0267 [Terriglobus saanensis SP1PR4]